VIPKKVLLSGVFGGIGREMCKSFNQQNIQVVGMDLELPDEHDLKLADFFQADLSKLDNLAELYLQIYEQHKDIDLVINNAGIAHLQPFNEETPEEFDQVMDINFRSIVISTRFWVDKFHTQIGCGIANMASMAGHVSPSGMTSYSA
jgi:NADP-dependent 3-hydroxy acid dehydrogenase YdfG